MRESPRQTRLPHDIQKQNWAARRESEREREGETCEDAGRECAEHGRVRADVDQAEELEEDAVVGHGVEDSWKREHRSQETVT